MVELKTDAQLNREWAERFEDVVNTHPKHKQLDDAGREVLDPRPVAPPLGYQRPPSMVETIRNMVRSELLRAEAAAAGMESFEEADDFDIDDDPDPPDPYTPFEPEFEPAVSSVADPKGPKDPPDAAASGGGSAEGAGAPSPQPSAVP